MRIELRSSLILVAVCLAGAFAAPSAHAQDEAAGRVLFEDAIALMNRGQFSEACPKFEESLRQVYNINAQYFLADCWEKQGKTASAWTTFLSVASKARETGDERRERAARKRADGLERRIVKLRVNVTGDGDVIEVRRNGVLVGRPMWSTAVPVDPGTYEFTATAPGFVPFVTTISATAVGKVVDVTIPALTRKAVPIVPVSSPVIPLASEPVLKKPAEAGEAPAKRAPEVLVKHPGERVELPAPHQGASPWRTVSWVAGGVGVGAMVAGGLVAVFAKRSFDSAKTSFDGCPDSACESDYLGQENRAISRANLGSALFIGGAALAAAAGVGLIVTSGSSAPDAPRSSVSLTISPVGLSLEGTL